MLKISEIKLRIEKEIKSLNYSVEPSNLYRPIHYLLNLKGKRIRPILLLMSHQLFDDNIEKSVDAALGIEIFHNFTLIHDDVMDRSLLRRGKETVHSKWNRNIAILSGDVMLVESYRYISNVNKDILDDILFVFGTAAQKICEGQQFDMDFEDRNNVSIDEYIKMIESKTAVLIAASLKIGAMIGGASQQDATHLYEFGKNIGIAFQLQDDLLDVYGNQEKFGKNLGGDIMTNKKTYLYLKALEDANQNQKKTLLYYYSGKDFENKEKLEFVKDLFLKLKIRESAEKIIMKYYNLATNHINQVNSKEKEQLLIFAKSLLRRES